MTVQVIYQNQ